LYTDELGEIEMLFTLGAVFETETLLLFALADTPMESTTVAEQ